MAFALYNGVKAILLFLLSITVRAQLALLYLSPFYYNVMKDTYIKPVIRTL